MDQSNPVVRRFFLLAAEAERIDASLDQPVEPALEAVLAHVLAHSEARAEFASAFIEIARDPIKGPPELIGYCMHALRWAEVQDGLQSWIGKEESERVRHVLRSMLQSFEDDWYDADLYSRFAKN